MSLVRPVWSAGTATSPRAWHSRQLSRPSSGWGIADAVGVAGGVGAGAGAGAGGGGVGTGSAPPPQAASNGSRTSMAITANITYFFITLPP